MSQAFICDGIRTPIGRYGGALSTVRPDDLAAHVLAKLVARNQHVDWSTLDDVILGCVNQAGEDNRNVARMASLLGGLGVETPGVTVNRLCGSGMNAIAMAAQSIKAGEADLIIAGGVESMTRSPYVMAKADCAWSRTQNQLEDTTIGWRFINPRLQAEFGIDSMPHTAENVAREHRISRADQDQFALRSQQRTARAQAAGFFADEICAVDVAQRKGPPSIFDHDEHPRADTTIEMLTKLRSITDADGSVTAGNASGVNDGAAALIIASERAVERFGLTPMARVRGCAVAGVAPRVMGIGPVPSTKKLLQREKLAIDDIDVIELNEAFAAQALAVLRGLGLADDAEHVNPHGGAIALGHPVGMSGARLVFTAARALKARRGKLGLATMCIGVGQGISLLIENC